jgi:hypothetical protein
MEAGCKQRANMGKQRCPIVQKSKKLLDALNAELRNAPMPMQR